jgi:hypothetical protein
VAPDLASRSYSLTMPTTPASVVDDRNTADPVIPQGVHDLRDGSVAAHGYDGRSHDLVGPSRYCAGGVGFRPVSYRSTLTPLRGRCGACASVVTDCRQRSKARPTSRLTRPLTCTCVKQDQLSSIARTHP